MNRVGVDIIEIDRIRSAIDKNPRFSEKIYTLYEREYIEKKESYRSAAGIFACKEAISKMLGTGISGFSWTDIEVVHDTNGKPNIRLYNNAKKLANSKKFGDIDISISHNRDNVVAMAVGSIKERETKKQVTDISIDSRKPDTHKGDYGRIALIGGSTGMCGSIYLSSISALRSGAGLVYTMVPSAISEIMQIKSIENIVVSLEDHASGYFHGDSEDITYRLEKLDAIGLGPGMGREYETGTFLKEILDKSSIPLVIDADGIFHLEKYKEDLKVLKSDIIITPHMGEFSNFTGIEMAKLEDDREYYAKKTALDYGLIVVLKGSNTLVTDGERVYKNKTGNPGMATAGSGDVLAGIITSLVGQGFDLFQASKLGVYIHGRAGDIASDTMGEYGIIASDIVKKIPLALREIEI